MLFLVVAAILRAGATPAPGPPTIVEWLRQPTASERAECMAPLQSGGPTAIINLRCNTAPGGQVAACRVIENSQPDDPRYEQVALCAARSFGIRATDAAGAPVMGVSVDIPMKLEPPVQPKPE